MFLTASLAHDNASSRVLKCWLGVQTISETLREDFCSFEQVRGVTALATTADLDSVWQLQTPAANVRQQHRPLMLGDTSAFTEMERPQVMHHNGRWHLFFSCWKKLVDASWMRRMLQVTPWIDADFTDSAMYHLVAAEPQGPFTPFEKGVIVQGSGATGLYGTTVVPRPDSRMFDIFGGIVVVSEGDASGLTMEVSGAIGFEWQSDGRPRVFTRHSRG